MEFFQNPKLHIPDDAGAHPGHAVGAEVVAAGAQGHKEREEKHRPRRLQGSDRLAGAGQKFFHPTREFPGKAGGDGLGINLAGRHGGRAEPLEKGFGGQNEGPVGQAKKQSQGDPRKKSGSIGPKEGQAEGQHTAQLVHPSKGREDPDGGRTGNHC